MIGTIIQHILIKIQSNMSEPPQKIKQQKIYDLQNTETKSKILSK